MLSELSIRNLAIIEDLTLPLAAGFNVLTGETGAGKSIILDAMMLVLGGRADASLLRSGSETAHIEATFKLDSTLQQTIKPILENEALESEAPDELLLTRIIKSTGRTVSRINGNTVSTRLLKQVGESLIDIHGQGAHLGLLQPRSHLPLLDRYAGCVAEQVALAERVTALRQLESELASLQQDERTLAQRVDMLTYQVQEIETANLQPDEEDELKGERNRLANAEQLSNSAAATTVLLLGTDDDVPSAIDLIGQAERALATLAKLDEEKAPLLAQLQGVASELNDVAADVQAYQEGLEFNPDRLNEIEGRLEQISTLKRKYGESVTQILAFHAKAAAELAAIQQSDVRKNELTAAIDRHLHDIGRYAQTLSKTRQNAAAHLQKAVEGQLGELRMNARFAVDFQVEATVDGAYVADERYAFDKTGIDKVEFLLSANPGEPPRPLAKVASGGETARIMLALKTALAQVDETPTLIFDEIDQGIGGRIGEVVGRKLWGLAAAGGHQVIVVTHLPQLAGYGDRHFHIRKEVVAGRTRTNATALDYHARVHELAAMLGTDSEHAIGGAAAILDNATRVKQV